MGNAFDEGRKLGIQLLMGRFNDCWHKDLVTVRGKVNCLNSLGKFVVPIFKGILMVGLMYYQLWYK